VGQISWMLALREAGLASLTAFVPNLLGKLLQFSALEARATPRHSNAIDCQPSCRLECAL
jgi:hypothetical protein